MSAAVHEAGGLWIAPFAPGFDARRVGGTREVPRRNGDTLRAEYHAAVASTPDALGLISWNEFSENTHVAPSQRYGDSALTVLTDLERGPQVDVSPLADSSDEQGDGAMTVQTGLLVLLLLAILLPIYARLRRGAGDRPGRQVRRSWSFAQLWDSRGGRIGADVGGPEGIQVSAPARPRVPLPSRLDGGSLAPLVEGGDQLPPGAGSHLPAKVGPEPPDVAGQSGRLLIELEKTG